MRAVRRFRRRVINSPSIRLATSLTELPTLSGHPSELQQLILNLLDNARQAGSRNIWLTTSAAAGSVQLLIQDDGAGLAPAVAARMFEPRRGSGGAEHSQRQ